MAILASSLIFIIGSIFMVGAVSTILEPSSVTYKNGSVLKITLTNTIVEDASTNALTQINPLTLDIKRSTTLLSLLNGIENAASDPNISGIYLDLSSMQILETSTINEIRRAIIKFKLSGKGVVCYSDIYTHSSYFLASAADKVLLAPTGELQWLGLAAESYFFKGSLEKLGIEPEIIRHGSYKSSTEPYTQDKMSEENRAQTKELLNSMWGYMVGEVASARDIDSTHLQKLATDLAINSSDKAVEELLVDELIYPDQIGGYVARELSLPYFNTISLSDYTRTTEGSKEAYSPNKVALIYVDGSIVTTATGTTKEVTSNSIISKLQKAASDDKVKAIVIRINSPGGSALASDNIWHAVKCAREQKPVVVSMGSIAASGGYYIAAAADIIVAEPTTTTGSIGVYGIMFNAQKGLKDKLGISVESVTTNPSADMQTFTRALSSKELRYLQSGVERTYDIFVEKVAEGRNLTIEEVNNIAQGRIWSGVDAQKVNLVDHLGGLKESILLAADRANVLSSFRIQTYNSDESTIGMLLNTIMGGTKISVENNTKIESRLFTEF